MLSSDAAGMASRLVSTTRHPDPAMSILNSRAILESGLPVQGVAFDVVASPVVGSGTWLVCRK